MTAPPLPTPDAGPAPSRAVRAAELFALFVALPLALRLRLLPLPRLAVLAVVTAGGLLALARDPAFDRRRLWSLDGLRAALPGILLRSAVAAGAIVLVVRLLVPQRLLALPLQHPLAWAAGLLAYPLLSVWPQEVLYRVFFFHRYRTLFPGTASRIAASAAAFSVLHLVYPNAVAPLLSLPAGLVFAWSYRRTGSMGPVWVEHTLYGLLIFSLGLDGYFYDGRI